MSISEIARELTRAGLPPAFALAEAFAAVTADWCPLRRATARALIFGK